MNRKWNLAWIPLAMTAWISGCGLVTRPAEGSADEELAEILAVLNADLGEQGTSVSLAEVEEAFRNDQELLDAVLSNLTDASTETVYGKVHLPAEVTPNW